MDSLDIAFAEARRYLASLDSRPVASRGSPADMRAPLPAHFPAHGMAATDVVRAIAAAAEPRLTGNAGGRFFAWVKGGALPAALATDVLCSAWDQNAVWASTSPAGAVLEEVAGRFLLDALRLPDDASYAFVTGCQMAHATALAAARHGVLARVGWDVEAKGLHCAPVVRVLANAHHHSSVTRALPALAALMELGRDGLAAMVERCCDHAAAIYDGIVGHDGAGGIARATLNQGLVRFHARDGSNISDAVIAAVNASGEAFFSGGSWYDERVMRISVCGWNTSAADVAQTVVATGDALARLR